MFALPAPSELEKTRADTIQPDLAPTSPEPARAGPCSSEQDLYFFLIVKEQPITSGQKPEPSAVAWLWILRAVGGADRDRTDDPLLAKQVLSQLSYSPPVFDKRRRSSLLAASCTPCTYTSAARASIGSLLETRPLGGNREP